MISRENAGRPVSELFERVAYRNPRGHLMALTSTGLPGRPFSLECECGQLRVEVTESEVGQIARIHWGEAR